MSACPQCGHANREGARFCDSCGAALAAAATAEREERKVVTVLFADLVGFTSRAERLDPEDVRATLSPYYARLRSELERFGGTVEKFIGDAVMALFGAPVTHEDDPERAVRAALAIRDAVGELSEREPGLELQVRIGVNTGEALVALGARPGEGEGMASGDVVNTAARLQTAAPVNGVLVGEATFRATARAIEYRDLPPIEAKGKAERVPVWEAVAPRARVTVEGSLTPSTPLVGRRKEVDLLLDALARTRDERSPQLVTLVGVPGIGKSRLVLELFGAVQRDPDFVFWRHGRSLPYGEGVSYWALAEIVKAHAGILESDSAQTAADKLAAVVEDAVPDADEADWVRGHLAPLVGLGGDAKLEGDRRGEAFAGWRRFLEAVAGLGPLVLVFEDLHWADDGLLDFVDHLADWASGVPLLVVCTARPELLARRPDWGGGKPNALTVSLSPLSDDETARVVAGLLEQAVLPAEIQAAMLSRAAGNPLYAEEYVRMLQDRGLLTQRDGVWRVAAGEELPLPESIQGIIAARLDAVSADEKALLQDASVVGRVFWAGSLSTLGGVPRWTVEERLHALARRELVQREQRTSVAGETEYLFRHGLVRDVAYAQLPRARRAEKHRLAAEWIEALGAERTEDRAEMLAHHYASALEYAGAAGQPTGGLAERARVALRDAGDRASGLSASARAAALYRRALELWPVDHAERPYLLLALGSALFDSEETGENELREASDALVASGDRAAAAEAESTLSTMLWRRGQNARGRKHERRALELLEGAPPSRSKARVLARTSGAYMVRDENEAAIRTGLEAVALAESLGLDDLRAEALINIGTARCNVGDGKGIEDFEDGLARAARLGSVVALTRGYGNLAESLRELGDLAASRDAHARARAEAERIGHRGAIFWLKCEQAIHWYIQGHWDEAARLLDKGVAEADAGVRYWIEPEYRRVRALLRLARGDDAGALEDASRALEFCREAEDPQVLYPALATTARVHFERGAPGDAERLVTELLDRWGVTRILARSGWVGDLALVLSSHGRGNELVERRPQSVAETPWLRAATFVARGDFAAAAEEYRRMGSVPDEASARLRSAERLATEGRRVEANAELASALEFYRSVRARRYLAHAERLLAASA